MTRIGHRPLTSRFAIPAGLFAAILGIAGVLTEVGPAEAASPAPTWSTLSPPASPPPLAYAAEAYDPANQTTVLFGGVGPAGAASAATWIWNGTTWSEAPTQVSGPPARELASLAYLPNASGGQMILFGGKSASGTPLGDTWAWNGGSWVAVGNPSSTPAPAPRFGASLALDATGKLVLFGGTGLAAAPQTPGTATQATRQGSPLTTSPPAPSSSVSSASVSSASVSAASVSAAAPSTTAAPATTPAPPGGVTEAPLATATTATATLDDTWVWNGSTWSQPDVTTAPPPRTDASLVWDQAIGQTVLFGGSATPVTGGAGNPLGDTWVWSGSAWTGLNPASSPPARYDAASGSAGAVGGDLLVGGNSGAGPLGDLWDFDGSSWTRLTPTVSIPARSGATAAGDPAASELMLFGGAGANGTIDATSILTPAPPVKVVPTPSTTTPPPTTSPTTTAPTTATTTPTTASHPGTAPTSIPARHRGLPAPTTSGGTGTHPGSSATTSPPTSKTSKALKTSKPSKSPSTPSTKPTPPPTAPTAEPRSTTTVPPLTVSPKGPTARITSPGSSGSFPSAAPSPPPPVVGSNAPHGTPEQRVHTGSLVTVVGSGFRPGALVVITFHSKPFTVGRTHATAAGTFSATVTVPTNASPGQHHLEAMGMGPHGRLSVLLTPLFVMGPITATSAAISSTTTLVMVAVAIGLPVGAWTVLWAWGKRGKGSIAAR